MTEPFPLPLSEYKRYGRQMVLDGFGLPAQLKLRESAVVVVGAGGLGCPALQYLAAAGIGKLGIIDHDTVDLSNLHRQVLHTEDNIGSLKACSAEDALKKINSKITIVAYSLPLSPANARTLLAPYDVILDCTDNAPTRYLLSDAAVVLGKPLVSGAAMKYEGQVCTYNLSPNGPCYRCLYPTPPAPEMIGTCEEIGVLGVVTGVIGTVQALECIKILTGLHDGRTFLHFFSALSVPPFRSAKLRDRRPMCLTCSDESQMSGNMEETDYTAFCGGLAIDFETTGLKLGNAEHRILGKDLREALVSGRTRILDVRPPIEFGICHLPTSINVPLPELVSNPASYLGEDPGVPTFLVCRLGNDSQIAANALREVGDDRIVKDLIGGLRRWSLDVDPSFPMY